jgi:hypothetical protein
MLDCFSADHNCFLSSFFVTLIYDDVTSEIDHQAQSKGVIFLPRESVFHGHKGTRPFTAKYDAENEFLFQKKYLIYCGTV